MDGKITNRTYDSGANYAVGSRNENAKAVVVGSGAWLIDNQDGILSSHIHSLGTNVVAGKKAVLLPIAVEEMIEPEESAECTGYDKDENALMVPMQGSNKIKLKIPGAPANLLSKIKIVAEPPGKLTISPETPTAAEQELTLSGTADALGVKVKLEIDGTKNDLFEADVLQRLERTIEIHGITEENDDVQSIAVGASGGANAICIMAGGNGFRDSVPSGDDVISGNNIRVGANGICDTTAKNQNLVPLNVPSAASLQSYLNRKTWGNQANVQFTVTRTDHVVNYDLNRNGQEGDANAASPEDGVISARAKSNAVNYNIYYVNLVKDTIGYTIIERGETWTGANGDNSPENHTAHEVGHLLRIPYESSSTIDVMYEYGISTNPCRVSRRDWRFIHEN